MNTQFLAAAALAALPASASAAEGDVADAVKALSKGTDWQRVDEIEVAFPTHHPQGMVKIDDTFYVSSVEIIEPTTRYDEPQEGYDRSTGEGAGHLFEIDSGGQLVSDTTLGEGAIYHPGGIDYDGEHIWIPVAEYRPNSASIIYRLDPETMEAEEVLRVDDHIGGVVHDTDADKLIGVSWGSRRIYEWPLNAEGEVAVSPDEALASRVENPAHYIDYQDCQYVGQNQALCSGLNSYRTEPEAEPFRLGGLELVDTGDKRPVWQVPVSLWAPSGRPMTQNPFFVEATSEGLRAWFMPDDDDSVIYVYEVE